MKGGEGRGGGEGIGEERRIVKNEKNSEEGDDEEHYGVRVRRIRRK